MGTCWPLWYLVEVRLSVHRQSVCSVQCRLQSYRCSGEAKLPEQLYDRHAQSYGRYDDVCSNTVRGANNGEVRLVRNFGRTRPHLRDRDALTTVVFLRDKVNFTCVSEILYTVKPCAGL